MSKTKKIVFTVLLGVLVILGVYCSIIILLDLIHNIQWLKHYNNISVRDGFIESTINCCMCLIFIVVSNCFLFLKTIKILRK